jgi:hypothetical protein
MKKRASDPGGAPLGSGRVYIVNGQLMSELEYQSQERRILKKAKRLRVTKEATE